MTKQEKIKDAYGCDVSGLVDNNGWTIYGSDEFGECGVEPFEEYETKNHIDGKYEWRPLSLKGIESNNGWVRIESEEDLPKEKELFHFIPCNSFEEQFIGFIDKDMDEVFFIDKYYGSVKNEYNIPEIKLNSWLPSQITHYQPIQKPKSPIY